MFLHPYYTPNKHNCTRKKSEMLLSQQRKSKNTIDTHIKLKLHSHFGHIRVGDFFAQTPPLVETLAGAFGLWISARGGINL